MVCIFSVKRTMFSIDEDYELKPCTNCSFCITMTLGHSMFDVTTETCIRAKYQRPGIKFCGQKKNQERVKELEKEIKDLEWELFKRKDALKSLNRK